jgi:hypothetical protein
MINSRWFGLVGLSSLVPGIGFLAPAALSVVPGAAQISMLISTCLIPQRLLRKTREQEGTLSGGRVGIMEEEVDGHFINILDRRVTSI